MSDKLNIVLMIGTNIWTGAEQHVYNQAKGLQDAGHNVTVVVRKNSIPYQRFMADFETVAYPCRNAFDLETIFRLAWLLVKKKIDIVHTHHNKVTWLAVFARMLARRGKVLNTLHMVQRYTKTKGIKLWLARKLDAIVCPSALVRDSYIRFNPLVDTGKIYVIHNGIDVQALQNYNGIKLRDELGLPADTFLFASVGRISPDKGTDLLLEAFAGLQDKNTRLILVGDDEGEFSQQMRLRAEAGDLRGRVIFYGSTKTIAKIMNGIDALVQPSRLLESFGQVLVEAMACGKPVIATNNGAQGEIIENGETGLLVTFDKEQILGALVYILNHGNEAARMGESACVVAMKNYSITAMCVKFIELYKELLEGVLQNTLSDNAKEI